MNHLLLLFTFLMVTAITTVIVTPTPAQAKLVQPFDQFDPMNIKTSPPFLIFLNSEYEPCLGTLIHKQWVLTAAHCFLPFLEIDIVASKEDISLNEMGNLRPMLTVQHPNFTRDSAEHDLMLIKLKHSLKLSDQIMRAGRGPENFDILAFSFIHVEIEAPIVDMIYPGITWLYMARGLWNPVFRLIHHSDSDADPDIQINQNVFWFSDKYCKESSVRQIPVKITENMFCAGSSLESIHTCKEMAAAPILCQNQLQGILSWSDGCILRGDVGYYTKVSHYTDWILKVIHTN